MQQNVKKFISPSAVSPSAGRSARPGGIWPRALFRLPVRFGVRIGFLFLFGIEIRFPFLFRIRIQAAKIIFPPPLAANRRKEKTADAFLLPLSFYVLLR